MLFSLKNIADEPLFNNLRKAVYLIFILPFSNACVERIFSQLKLIKTDNRNHLDTSSINMGFPYQKSHTFLGSCHNPANHIV